MASSIKLFLFFLLAATAFSQNVVTDSTTLLYNQRHGISADFQLACNTGPLRNEFTVTVSPSAGDGSVRAPTGSMHLVDSSGKIKLASAADPGTAEGVEGKFVLTGLLSQLEAGSSQSGCDGSLLNSEDPACARTQKGVIDIQQFTVVPNTQRSPLFRSHRYRVIIECKLVPEPAKADLLEAASYIGDLLECEEFGFTLLVNPLPEPADAVVELAVARGSFRSGLGYTLENCYIQSDLPPASTAIVLNGVAISGKHAEVSGRKSERDYQLTLHNISPAATGKINCEIRQCRTSTGYSELKECPAGDLPQQNTESGRTLTVGGNAMNLSPGTVTLVKDRPTMGRSARRCEGQRL